MKRHFVKKPVMASDNNRQLEVFKHPRYGDYWCACGCGQKLEGMCPTIGDVHDEEGFEWRAFTPECFNRLKAAHSISELYNMFETNETVD